MASYLNVAAMKISMYGVAYVIEKSLLWNSQLRGGRRLSNEVAENEDIKSCVKMI